MINIAVCDDDICISTKIENSLRRIGKEQGISLNIEVFGDGEDLVDDIYNGEKYDIIYLDIEMKKLNGLDTARKIRCTDKIVSIIYITGYKSYAIDAFEVQPFQFIVKPIDQDRFARIFMAAYHSIIQGDYYFRYNSHRQSYKILISDIIYFESQVRTVKIFGTGGQIITYYAKMNEIEQNINKSKAEFWRIHQSYLVNRRHIYRISYSQVEMTNGTILSISEERRKSIREKYLDSIGDGIIE